MKRRGLTRQARTGAVRIGEEVWGEVRCGRRGEEWSGEAGIGEAGQARIGLTGNGTGWQG